MFSDLSVERVGTSAVAAPLPSSTPVVQILTVPTAQDISCTICKHVDMIVY